MRFFCLGSIKTVKTAVREEVLSKTDLKFWERMEVPGSCDRQISKMNPNDSHH